MSHDRSAHPRDRARPAREVGARLAHLATLAAVAVLTAGCPTPGSPDAPRSANAGVAAPAAGRGASATLVSAAASANPSAGGELSTTAVPDGAIGIGVAHDPSLAGMAAVAQGVTLAVEHLNAASGDLRFVARTNSPGVTSAVQIATELRDDPRVVGVVGHSESGSTLDAIPVYEDVEGGGANALVAISPTATSPRLTGRSPWFFRVCPSDLAVSRAIARYALDTLGARRAAIVYRNDSYGRDWTKEFVAAFTAGGGAIVQRDPYLPGITEWAAYAGYMQALQADVFLYPGSLEDAVLSIRALRAIGADIPFIGGDAASALAASPDEFAGERYTAFFDARTASGSEARAFVARFRERFGMDPDQRAALAYDAALLIGEAARAVGTDRMKIRDHLERLGTDLPAVDGVAGAIAFDRNHDPRDTRVIVARVAAR